MTHLLVSMKIGIMTYLSDLLNSGSQYLEPDPTMKKELLLLLHLLLLCCCFAVAVAAVAVATDAVAGAVLMLFC